MTTCPSASAPAEAEAISLYDAIGGRPALVAAVDGLNGRLLADPELGALFPDGAAGRHRRHVVTFFVRRWAVPKRYRGPDIVAGHRGPGISDTHCGRTAAHLGATLDELGAPRHLADRIVAIVAGLQQAGVTV